MDFDREVGEAFQYREKRQALLKAVAVKAAKEREAAAAAMGAPACAATARPALACRSPRPWTSGTCVLSGRSAASADCPGDQWQSRKNCSVTLPPRRSH
jgi:hypothetical protein